MPQVSKNVLQEALDELSGFLVKIEVDMREESDTPSYIFEILFPAAWLTLEHADFVTEKIPLSQSATRYKISLRNKSLGADAVLAHISKLIRYNEEIEEKQQELMELQRRRETEIQLEIEQLKQAFLKGESVPQAKKEEEFDFAFMRNSRANKKPISAAVSAMVQDFEPEREEEEDSEAVEETY